MKPLSLEAAKQLPPASVVWIETQEPGQAGLEVQIVKAAADDCLRYDNRSKRWEYYNSAPFGWRVWRAHPSPEERQAAPWDAAPDGA